MLYYSLWEFGDKHNICHYSLTMNKSDCIKEANELGLKQGKYFIATDQIFISRK